MSAKSFALLKLKKKFRANKLISRAYWWLRIDELKIKFGSSIFEKKIDEAINKFIPSTNELSTSEIKHLKADMRHCYYVCKAFPDEYFLLGLSDCSDDIRKTFVTDQFMFMTMEKYVSRKRHDEEIEDKYNFYLLAKPYFKRNVMKFTPNTKFEEFCQFSKANPDLIVKPLDAAMGKGILAVSIHSHEEARNVYERLLNKGGSWIVEDRIIQSPEMAVWNESSVNTIRFLSFMNKKDGFHALKPFLRTGRKGSVVDNAGSGGIFANINVETGQVSTCGIDEMGHRYEKHPDSGINFAGWQIPRYEELVATVREMHEKIMPDHPYIGWDMALTDEGWVVIECNWGQFVNQYIDHIGLKNEFMSLITGKQYVIK